MMDDLRWIVVDLSRILAEDETPAGTAARARLVALSRMFFTVESLICGDLEAALLWLEDANWWIAEAARRRLHQAGIAGPGGMFRF